MREIDLVAVAGFLHDIGKFAQRAEVYDKDSRYAGNINVYSPKNRHGVNTHLHAVCSALAVDDLFYDRQNGDDFKKPIKPNMKPFGIEDNSSFINTLAKHHKPQSSYEWIIAMADRISSGFEREDKFDEYNNL
ncbi:MAG: HD domain-containing protein [Campylobacterales bacterium]|nr:HD domain-containing protein [Campylobacterales bacterium]